MAEGIILTGPYLPGFGTQVIFFKVGVSAVAGRLGTLIGGTGIPMHLDTSIWQDGIKPDGTPSLRPYRHVFFQVGSDQAGNVWFTHDNNTVPVVGGPGGEFQKGVIYKFEHAGDTLLRGQTAGNYPVNAASAFQLIAAGDQFINVWFAD